jgi:hypothetical protein
MYNRGKAAGIWQEAYMKKQVSTKKFPAEDPIAGI